jgi:hypothetical protein
MLNSDLESLNGLKPHSYIVNFSASSNLDDKTYDKKKIIVDKTILKIKKTNILIILCVRENFNFLYGLA